MASKHVIPISTAAEMTKRFREKKEEILADAYKGKGILAKCETFTRDAFDQLLSQEGCTGIRVYYGMGDEDKVHAIFVGVDANNKDMLRTSVSNMVMDSTDDAVMENGERCPDNCPPDSDLNTP